MMISKVFRPKPHLKGGGVRDGKGLCAHGGVGAPRNQRKEERARKELARVDLRLQSPLEFQQERGMLRRVELEEDSLYPQRE